MERENYTFQGKGLMHTYWLTGIAEVDASVEDNTEEDIDFINEDLVLEDKCASTKDSGDGKKSTADSGIVDYTQF